MEITLRRVNNPDPDFYYRHQFEVYHEPYLIWERETWVVTLARSDVYCIEVDGRYSGDAILEDRRKGKKYLADFNILPEFQGRGVGKTALERLKNTGDRLTAFTRRDTLGFFMNCGFIVRRTMTGYFFPGIDRYYVTTP